MRHARSFAIVAVIAVSLTACSGSDSDGAGAGPAVSATDWTKAVCTSLVDWQGAITSRQSSFTPDATDLDALKQGWLDFLDGVLEDTDVMLGEVEGAGVPDVDGGSDAAVALVDAMTGLRGSFQSLRDRSAELPTADATAFSEQLQTLLADLQSDLEGMGTSIEGMQDIAELDAAFKDDPACASLQG